MGSLLDTPCVVDGNDIQWGVLPAMPTPQKVSSDSPKPIDRHLQLCLYHSPPVTPVSANLYVQLTLMLNTQYVPSL